MNSIGGEECTELKKQYDACFNQWFSEKFLRGHTDDSACAPIFKVYQQCVHAAIKHHKLDVKEIESDHLGTAKESKKPDKKS